MRIYLPATLADLAAPEGLPPRRAHARTPALARAMADTDPEAGEFQALMWAAADSLQALLAAPTEPLARVVVAADVDDVSPEADQAVPSAVRAPATRWSQVASFHVDDPGDADVQAILRAALTGADDAIAAASNLDLLWYDATERADLLTWRRG